MAQQTVVIEVPGTPISELEPTSSVTAGDVIPLVQGEETKKAPLEQIVDLVKKGLGTAALKNENDFATPTSVTEVSRASQMRDDAQNERIDTLEYLQQTTAGGYFKSYLTLAQANADIANIPLNVTVKVMSATEGGDYFKDVASATTLTKSPYDLEKIFNGQIDSKTNINLYRGINAHNPNFNANSFDKTTTKLDYAPTEIRYKNLNVTGGFSVPFNGELRSKIQVWAKVKSAVLNAGTMRLLVQAIKNDGSNFLSVYGTIPNGTVGWIKLAELTSLTEANRAVFNRLTITPHVVNGAELIIEDFYIGESVPTTAFVRTREPIDRVTARVATRRSLLPKWTLYPNTAGVVVNENGDISIPANGSYVLTFNVENASRINYCGYIDQVATGDCRLYFRGFRAGTSPATFHDIPYFPTAVGGVECIGAVQFDSLVSSVQLTITNFSTTDPITLRSFDICYDAVAVNGQLKIGDKLDIATIKTDIIQSVVNTKPIQNYSSAPNSEFMPKNLSGKRVVTSNRTHFEFVTNGNIKPNTTYYVSFPDAVATLGTGTAQCVFSHVRADISPIGGVSRNFSAGGGVLNVPLTTTAETYRLAIAVNVTGDATVELGRMLLTEVQYATDKVFSDYFISDGTGTVVSDFDYPTLSGFTKYGLSVDYPISTDGTDRVLSIPNTTATGDGQGLRWIVNMPKNNTKNILLTFLAKLNMSDMAVNPTKLWIRYFRDGSTTEMGAEIRTLTFNRDNSYALNQVWIPAKYGPYDVSYIEMYIYINSTATAPLQLKRFIKTLGIHNPYVAFIKYLNDVAPTGLSDYLRLKDALTAQPQNVFSVGRQLFRPLKTVQQTASDYELMNGQSLLPNRLNNLRYIDSDGFLIAFIDRDDTVYLRKGTALYKTTVDDLNSRCIATTTVGTEKRGVFNSAGLNLINANAPAGFMRVTGDGTFVLVSRTTAFYSIDQGVTWLEATGYQDVNGEHYNAWGTDCSDNVVLTSGYKLASEGRGKGRINFSKDNGKTYQVILDIETSPFIDDARRGSMHIHSMKYDPFWQGVWVVMGDGAFQNPNSTVTSNIWFIENPATAQQSMISYDSRGQDWLNEQHVSVFPMQDCILFGSDANPTGLYRMARTKNVKAFRDVAVPISTALSHYGCGGYQHQQYLPATIYFGKASEYTGNLNDKVFLTYDGVNIVEIYTEPETSNIPSGKVNTFAFALDKHFIFERRTDQRFASGNTWIVADIRYIR